MSAALASFVRQKDGAATLDLVVGGARCAGCLSKIENGLRTLPNVQNVRMNLSTSRLHLSWEGGSDQANGFAAKLEEMGFSAGPYLPSENEDRDKAETRRLLMAMAVAAFGLMNVMILSIAVWSGTDSMSDATRSMMHWLSAAIALPIAAFSGRPFFLSAKTALQARTTNMDVPISLAILLACGLSVWETWHGYEHTYFDAALMLIFLLLIGRVLDARLRARTGQAARQLAALQVQNARRILADGQTEIIPALNIRPGDQLRVAVGERIPADGTVLSGTSQIDAALVTGETELQPVGPDDPVYSGTINRGGPLIFMAQKASSDSLLADITAMVEAGQQSQARYVRLADQAARAYVPIVHTLALMTLLGWLILGGIPRTAILNAIAVLIITCPCALGLAVPAVQVVSIGRLFSKGILVRSGDALERLAKTRHVIFDKTGTLTQGRITADVSALDPEQQATLQALAAHSSHPMAQALQGSDATALTIDAPDEVEGQGLVGQVGGQTVRLGQASFVGLTEDQPGLWAKFGDDDPISISVNDPLRPEIHTLLSDLRARELDVSILSGDANDTVADLAYQLGISEFKGRAKPADKLAVLSAKQKAGIPVLMVGDGLNDAPALAHANASAALASGMDITRAASDIVLQGDTLSGLPFAIDVARAAKRRVLENFSLAVAYNMLAVPLAVFGFVTPLVAAVAMSGSSLLVTLNALRMSRVGTYDGPDHPGRTYQSGTA